MNEEIPMEMKMGIPKKEKVRKGTSKINRGSISIYGLCLFPERVNRLRKSSKRMGRKKRIINPAPTGAAETTNPLGRSMDVRTVPSTDSMTAIPFQPTTVRKVRVKRSVTTMRIFRFPSDRRSLRILTLRWAFR